MASEGEFRPGLKPRGHESVVFESTRELVASWGKCRAPRVWPVRLLDVDKVDEEAVVDEVFGWRGL